MGEKINYYIKEEIIPHFFAIIVEKFNNSANPRPHGAKAHSRQAKRTKFRQIQESVGLKPNAEWKKDAKAPS